MKQTPGRRPPRLESWVEETERKVRLIIDHYPRCRNRPKCTRILFTSAPRPWVAVCPACGYRNTEVEIV